MYEPEYGFDFDVSTEIASSIHGGFGIDKKYEFMVIYGWAKSSTVNMYVDNCNCTFSLKGPIFTELGAEFRYTPYSHKRISPFLGLRYSLGIMNDQKFGTGYVDSVAGLKYVILNIGPRTRVFSNRSIQLIALSLGANARVSNFLSLLLRVDIVATTSESPMHLIQYDFEKHQERIQNLFYHSGVQTRITVGIRLIP